MSLLIQHGLVSVVIPVFNQSKTIGNGLVALLAQTYRPIEVIVVDDGSTDGTIEVLNELAAQYSELRVFGQENLGLSAARELGRLNAKGEFVQYFECNAALSPNKFALQVSALKEMPDCDVAYGKVPGNHFNPLLLAASETMFPLFLRQRYWNTAVPLYRRSVVDRAGAWLDTHYDEEWEYDCRIASLGGRIVFVDEYVLASEFCSDVHRLLDEDYLLRLQHQCLVRAKVFRHAQKYMQLENRVSDIEQQDWEFYSDAAFALGRECALADLTTQARAMLSLSVESIGKKTPRHRFFLTLVKWFGWKKAAQATQRGSVVD